MFFPGLLVKENKNMVYLYELQSKPRETGGRKATDPYPARIAEPLEKAALFD